MSKVNETLIESDKFSQVLGIHHNAKYVQNGEYYDANKDRIKNLSPKFKATKKKKKPKKTDSVVDNRADAKQGEVNLQLWSEGKEQHHWTKIQVAVEMAVGTRPKSKDEAMELLNKHSVIKDANDVDNSDGE